VVISPAQSLSFYGFKEKLTRLALNQSKVVVCARVFFDRSLLLYILLGGKEYVSSSIFPTQGSSDKRQMTSLNCQRVELGLELELELGMGIEPIYSSSAGNLLLL
jgi:hypothetical protein